MSQQDVDDLSKDMSLIKKLKKKKVHKALIIEMLLILLKRNLKEFYIHVHVDHKGHKVMYNAKQPTLW